MQLFCVAVGLIPSAVTLSRRGINVASTSLLMGQMMQITYSWGVLLLLIAWSGFLVGVVFPSGASLRSLISLTLRLHGGIIPKRERFSLSFATTSCGVLGRLEMMIGSKKLILIISNWRITFSLCCLVG